MRCLLYPTSSLAVDAIKMLGFPSFTAKHTLSNCVNKQCAICGKKKEENSECFHSFLDFDFVRVIRLDTSTIPSNKKPVVSAIG